MMAYHAISDGLEEMGETAIKTTVVDPIRVQEPGHFAFYRMSAHEMVQQKVLAPWQLHLAGVIRSRTFAPVGAKTLEQRAGFGAIVVNLGLEADIERTVRDVVRVEAHLLDAQRDGMKVPRYALAAFRDAADLYRERRLQETAAA